MDKTAERIFLETLGILTAAIEELDPWMKGRPQQVAGMCVYLAQALRCPQEEVKLTYRAALLHDLGTLISYDDHHLHSQSLIINSGLPGFRPRETALIGLMTRYHRKGRPRIDGFEQLLQEGDEQRLMYLAAILRLAEFLERGRNANVDDVGAHWDEKTLYLTLYADEFPAVEIWEAERNAAGLIGKAFGRGVIIESTAAPGDWRV